MLLKYYRIPTSFGWLKLTVAGFEGKVGGLEANVNRWRRQLGLGPINDISSHITTKTLADRTATIVDIVSKKPMIGTSYKRTHVTIVRVGSRQYFFKLVGKDEAITSVEKSVWTALTTVTFK